MFKEFFRGDICIVQYVMVSCTIGMRLVHVRGIEKERQAAVSGNLEAGCSEWKCSCSFLLD